MQACRVYLYVYARPRREKNESSVKISPLLYFHISPQKSNSKFVVWICGPLLLHSDVFERGDEGRRLKRNEIRLLSVFIILEIMSLFSFLLSRHVK
jgi:hypothetical protein